MRGRWFIAVGFASVLALVGAGCGSSLPADEVWDNGEVTIAAADCFADSGEGWPTLVDCSTRHDGEVTTVKDCGSDPEAVQAATAAYVGVPVSGLEDWLAENGLVLKSFWSAAAVANGAPGSNGTFCYLAKPNGQMEGRFGNP